jgi:hypothetical protein
MAARSQFRNERKPGIYATIGDDARLAFEAKRLAFVFGLSTCLKQRVAKPQMPAHPNLLRIGATKLLKIRQPLQHVPIDRRTVKVEDADEAAHGVSEFCKGHAGSKVA